mmetsp:Transcript_437/g.975  ORF Transcript_437/g.975 Transcript_437/m.975 type:complete len:222 (+) Transcript_437:3194-3859(+)
MVEKICVRMNGSASYFLFFRLLILAARSVDFETTLSDPESGREKARNRSALQAHACRFCLHHQGPSSVASSLFASRAVCTCVWGIGKVKFGELARCIAVFAGREGEAGGPVEGRSSLNQMIGRPACTLTTVQEGSSVCQRTCLSVRTSDCLSISIFMLCFFLSPRLFSACLFPGLTQNESFRKRDWAGSYQYVGDGEGEIWWVGEVYCGLRRERRRSRRTG